MKYLYGFPLSFFWGYVAVAVFMTGDGFEMAFLSKHIVDLGFTPSQAAMVITVYGLAAAVSAWATGVIAELITPQRAMAIGFIFWCVLHALFMVFGLGQNNYPLMLLFYGLRGLAYPLFIYSFVLLLVQKLPSKRVAAATGWFWAVYTLGMGAIGSFLPSLTIPAFGETGTLWFAMLWVFTGGIIAMLSLRRIEADRSRVGLPFNKKVEEMTRAVTILFSSKDIFFSCILRMVNTVSYFGIPVIMPILFVDRLNYTVSEWLLVWTVYSFVTIFTNIFWGIAGEYLGWMRQIRWFGCLGMALATLSFYYIPVNADHNIWLVLIPAVLMGIAIAAFVPMTSVFTTLEPNHKGAVLSVYNLSAGLSNCIAPAIAFTLLPLFDIAGVIWAYTGLYLFAGMLTFFIRVEQFTCEPKQSETLPAAEVSD